MEVLEILKELLFTHECVILPEFGGFITRDESAQFDRINYSFTPPRRIISFNPLLKHDDGLMVTAIAQKKNIDYSDAKKLLQQEVFSMNEKLSTEEFLLLPGLGKLTNHNGIIDFTPHYNLNFNKELFGLPAIQAKRVISTTAKQKNASTFKEWQSYAAAIVFALGIGTVGIYANKSMLNAQLSSFFPIEINHQDSKAQVSNKANAIVDKKITQENIAKPLKISIPNLKETPKQETSATKIKPYQVIGGSHKKYYKAMEQEAEFKRKGFPNAIIIGNVNGFTMVAYETFDNKEEALELKRTLEQKGKDVFLRVQ